MNGSTVAVLPGALLAIDAAPGVGSVALVRAGEVVSACAVPMRPQAKAVDRPAHPPNEDPLMLAVAETLRGAGLTPFELAGVACGAGPGGFTSLRIAAAIAKGLAHAIGCAFLAAPSLAWAAAVRAPSPGVWLVTLDALRGERYIARVQLAGALGAPRRGGWPVATYDYLGVHASDAVAALADAHTAVGVLDIDADATRAPIAAGAVAVPPSPVDLALWEPAYGRLAEAQARWEAEHGPLPHGPLLAAGPGGLA